MQRPIAVIPLLALIVLLAGCDDSGTSDPLAQMYRANQELHQQCEAQARVIYTMGGSLILLGACLAVSIGVLLKKGGRQRATEIVDRN